MAEQNKNTAKRKRRPRGERTFPPCSFEEALSIAQAIQRFASGQAVRRLTLFDQLGKSPDSGPSRSLITNARYYGLITGNYSSEYLDLTADGHAATSEEVDERTRRLAVIKLAIQQVVPFNSVYEKMMNNKLPAKGVLIDAMKEAGVLESLLEEAVETFIVNAKYAGLLQTLSGAERLVSIEHLLESLPASASRPAFPVASAGSLITSSDATFSTTCFYITPIGAAGSEQRQHSDLFLSSIVEPAVEPFGLRVVRADAIDKPGLITRQVIEFLLKSRLVIADLSYHNPNVFYELAIRHAARLPTVQITRSIDKLPFDVNQNRTIHIDTESIFTLVPQLETYKSEISSQVRRALEDPDATDNPITLFWPSLKVSL